MFNKFLGLSICVLPWMVNLPVSNAQSWQEWSDQNPTYRIPEPSSGSTPSPRTPAPQSPVGGNPAPQAQSNPARPPLAKEPTSEEYFSTQNPLFEQHFMAGCQQESLPISYCQCTLKEIQNTYTFNEVLQITSFMQEKGEIPSEILNVSMKCIPG